MLRRFEMFAGKIANQRHLKALRDGIVLGMPLIIIGSIFLILGNLPIPGYTEMLADIGLSPILNKIVDGSFGIMALIASFGIARSLAEDYNVDGTSAGMISLSAFLIVTPNVVSDTGSGIPYLYVGSQGLFVAIIVALISAEIFRFFIQKDFTIKMPEGVPPAVAKSFAALLPGLMVIITWGLVYLMLTSIGTANIHEILTNTLGRPLGAVGSSIWGTLFIVLLNSLFWFVGVHGANTVNPVISPIWLQNTDANRLAFQAGDALPNIITNEFMMNFVWIGGGGATIGLVLALFFLSKSKKNKMMGRLSVAPGIFNINEPVVFGLPIVLNFKLIIPYVLAPLATAVITYIGMNIGWVARPAGIVVPWTMPPIISGYLATGGKISGALVQVVTVAVSIMIYYPFVRATDRDAYADEESSENKTL